MTDLHARIAELCDMLDEANPGMHRTLAVNDLGRITRENATEILTALRIAERVMDDIAKIAAGLSDVQKTALKNSVYLAGSWGLSTWNEDHPDIIEGLSETLADCVSGELTPLGLAVRDYLRSKNDV